jgi:soluble lytic murein transglycosylase-like protein
MLLALHGGGYLEKPLAPLCDSVESLTSIPVAIPADPRTTAHRHLATRIRGMHRQSFEAAPSNAVLMPKIALAHEASIRHQVPIRLVLAVIYHESRFNPRAVSHRGAVGLMQVMPAVARSLAEMDAIPTSRPLELSNSRTNIEIGVTLLRRLHDRYGSWDRALAHYNGGWRAFVQGGIRTDVRVYVQRVNLGADFLLDRPKQT